MKNYIYISKEEKSFFGIKYFDLNKAYFDPYHIFKFYFMSYTSDSINMKTGYYVGTRIIDSNNINYYDLNKKNIIENEENPLDFFENTLIKKLTFIKNTKYIYYEIYS